MSAARPTAPAPNTTRLRAGLHVEGVGRHGAGAGDDPAAERAELLEREGLVDHDRVARRWPPRGWRRTTGRTSATGSPAPHASVTPVEKSARRPSRLRSQNCSHANGPLGQARLARAARLERQHDVVADLDAGDVGADGLDHAGALVAADDRRGRDRALAARQHVGVAHAGADDAHEQLVGPRVGQLDLLDRVRLVLGAQDGGGDLHEVLEARRKGIRTNGAGRARARRRS